MHTHAHTHMSIHIYIYIYICTQKPTYDALALKPCLNPGSSSDEYFTGSKAASFAAVFVYNFFYAHTHIWTHTHIYVDMPKHTHTHQLIYIHAHRHTHMYTHTHTHTNMNTHTHIYIYAHVPKHHHHHQDVPLAWISLTLSRHFSLSFITFGRFSGLHPVSSHSCCMYVRAGRPAFAWPYAGVHRNTSLMSSA